VPADRTGTFLPYSFQRSPSHRPLTTLPQVSGPTSRATVPPGSRWFTYHCEGFESEFPTRNTAGPRPPPPALHRPHWRVRHDPHRLRGQSHPALQQPPTPYRPRRRTPPDPESRLSCARSERLAESCRSLRKKEVDPELVSQRHQWFRGASSALAPACRPLVAKETLL
jgi:hypothetical protein